MVRLADAGVIPPLCGLLQSSVTSAVALAVMQRILRVGQKRAGEGAANPYCAQMEECDGVAELIRLQHQDDEADVVAFGAEILVEFFPKAVGL